MRRNSVAGIAGVLLESARFQVRNSWRHPMLLVGNILQPMLLLWLVIQRHDIGDDPTKNGLLASAVLLTSFWGGIIWTAGGMLRRDRAEGTLTRTVLNAHDSRMAVLGRSIGATILSLVTLLLAGTVTLSIIGARLSFPGVGRMIAGIAVLIIAGTAVSMLLSCVFLATRHGVAVTNAITYPVFILGGLLIPAEILPPWAEYVSWLVSLSWIYRFIETGDWGFLLICGVITMVYYAIGSYLFNRILNQVTMSGTVTHV